jgi:hypothetical protein
MPALLRIKRSISNDVWKISFSLDTQAIPESDKELIRKFGEPQINVGGTVTYFPTNPVDPGVPEATYTLPDKYIRVRTDLPYTQDFDSKSVDFSEDTQVKALAFQEKFVSDYAAAFTALRAKADTFTGESIENI